MNTLARFIRGHRDAIVGEWLSRAGQLPSSRGLPTTVLRNHVPDIVDRLADAIDRRDYGPRPLEDLPEQHAILGFREGSELRQVVAEYRLLRHVIIELYRDYGDLSADSRSKMEPLTVMQVAVDCAISEAVDQYAVERDRVRDRFIAILGHDLRDPLNTILFTANAQLARRGELNGRTVKAAARTEAAARRMERMIADLLDFARVRLGGGFSVVPTSFDARVLVSETVPDIALSHPERDVRYAVDHAPGNFTVHWDRDRIAQVIANLLGNALVHGRDPVVVSMTDQGDEIALAVANGGEIAADLLPRLFDPFVADEPTGRRQGLGLGLYIVKEIAQAHGGTVRAESVNGTTTLYVKLPRKSRQKIN